MNFSQQTKKNPKFISQLVDNGLNDSHVDTIIELLGETLKELDVADADITEIAGIANSVRDDVLNR
ncbi:MAG: hypothetical protein QM484_07615 [Woeseiaceae bacterium]